MEEDGGVNLYGALLNSPLNQYDSDGAINKNLIKLFSVILVYYRGQETGEFTAAPYTEWLRGLQTKTQIEMTSLIEKGGGKSSGPGGLGKPPKDFYQAGTGTGKIWSFAITGMMATYSSLSAAVNLALDTRSEYGTANYAIESALINASRGDTLYADLDAIEASLLMTGGSAGDALMAWDVITDVTEIFSK